MYIAQENQLLYPATWEYNAARILTELAKMVSEANGSVKPLRKARLVNRSVTSAKRKYEEKITLLTEKEKENHNEKRAAAITEYRNKLDQIERVNTEPITVTHTSYILFTLDGYMYSYSFSDNPFFEFYYSKTPLINGNQYSLDTYSTEDPKEWMYDCFFSFLCSDSDIKEAANLIFNMLTQAKPDKYYRKMERRRVPNTYDGGYHYENIPVKERMGKVDW